MVSSKEYIIPTELGSISSPICPKQPVVFFIAKVLFGIIGLGMFPWIRREICRDSVKICVAKSEFATPIPDVFLQNCSLEAWYGIASVQEEFA